MYYPQSNQTLLRTTVMVLDPLSESLVCVLITVILSIFVVFASGNDG